MIPIRDDNPTRIQPVVTIGLIAANVTVFLFQFLQPESLQQRFVFNFGTTPDLLFHESPAYWLTIFSSMFLHGGIMHLGGNMLYLWIFGNNIEDKLGHFRFIVFYLICGIIAALSHAFSDPSSQIPMIGASGAISGILGAYILLFPRASVTVLFWFFFFIRTVQVPAVIVLGVWFIMQLTNVLGTAGGQGGVAFWAHIGGFIAGMALVYLFKKKEPRPYLIP